MHVVNTNRQLVYVSSLICYRFPFFRVIRTCYALQINTHKLTCELLQCIFRSILLLLLFNSNKFIGNWLVLFLLLHTLVERVGQTRMTNACVKCILVIVRVDKIISNFQRISIIIIIHSWFMFFLFFFSAYECIECEQIHNPGANK